MNDLFDLRVTVGRAMQVLLWVHVPLIAGTAWLAGNDVLWPPILAALVAGVSNWVFRLDAGSASTRLTTAVAFVAMVSLVLASCHGTQWQFEVHLYYFAALAMLAAYCDRTVIVAAALATAVHHLALNFVAPALVFPNGAEIWRVVAHAGILVLEAATLVWLTHRIVWLFESSARHLDEALAASQAARQADAQAAAHREAAEAERERNEGEKAKMAAEDRLAMDALAEGLAAMAQGDLTHRFTAEVAPRVQILKTNFNAAIEQLQQTVSVVLTNVAAIRSGSNEISQAADDLSRRTEQQAASLEETAAALDEITATVNKTASGARQASNVVQAAHGDAETSGAVVRDAVAAMSAIEKSAGQISQIIGVIDEIAFQTNLLALNAGVEAARAGDAGRGFAVVASEVRALAQRSAEAAKEIKALISASTAQVGAGVTLVGQTGEALQRIVGRVAEIDGLVTEIAASAHEQSIGLQQVNTAVNQMDQVTQQNAAMVEESTAASHSLAQEAEALASSVSRFQVGDLGDRGGRTPAPPRPAMTGRRIPALRTAGRGGAVRKPEPVANEDRWEEF